MEGIVVERLVWLYYIASALNLILGIWLGHVLTLAAQRKWIEYSLAQEKGETNVN
jgi:hypothetical protein